MIATIGAGVQYVHSCEKTSSYDVCVRLQRSLFTLQSIIVQDEARLWRHGRNSYLAVGEKFLGAYSKSSALHQNWIKSSV